MPPPIRALGRVTVVMACLTACVAPYDSKPVRSAAPAVGPSAGLAPPVAGPARPGALVLPREVDVILSSVESRPQIAVEGRKRGELTIARTPQGVQVLGSETPPAPIIVVRGPVRIGDATHRGDVLFTPRAKGGLRATARLPLETYVAAVVAAEIPLWSAAPAELEAQAIAARTFAIQTLRTRIAAGVAPELMDGVLDQAYDGSFVAGGSPGAQRAEARLDAAVRATAGLCLMRGDSLEEARYHASCGGQTASFEDVFASEVASRGARGPLGVRCPPCRRRAEWESAQRAPDAKRPLGWMVDLDPTALAVLGKALGLSGRVSRLFPIRRDRGGRWLEVHVEGPTRSDSRRVTFEALRKVVGYKTLKSANLATTLPRPGESIPQGASLRIQGRGRGHGVGLCQESLRELAQGGWSSDQILRHYYAGARVARLPMAPSD